MHKLIIGRNTALCVMFFFSGLCALLYETIWLRLSFASFGVITPVLSVVISIFMGGLGLGFWIGGKYIASWKQKTKFSAITIYGLAEIFIGTGALLVPFLFKCTATVLRHFGDIDSWSYTLGSSFGICISILPWAFAMGSTYPLMLEFMREDGEKNSRQFSRLYAANTAGAVLGTLLTVFVFIEMLGFKRTLLLGSCINFIIGIMATLWGLRYTKVVTQQENFTPDEVQISPDKQFAFLVLFITGFCSIAMEIVWIRAFAPMIGSLVYSFAVLLVIYLVFNWLGAFLYRYDLANHKLKSKSFLIVATAVSSSLILLTNNYSFCDFIIHYLGKHFSYCLLLTIPIGIFSMFLGYLTPFIIDDITDSLPAEIGRAYAINIIGCILGPLFSGYFLLPIFGSKTSLVLLTLPLLALVLICRVNKTGITVSRLSTIMTVTIVLPIFLFSYSYPSWEEGGFLRAKSEENQQIYRDYAATTIALTRDAHKQLIVNGMGMTEMSSIVKLMAHLPLALLQKPPQSVLVIGFGMGTTFKSALCWKAKVTAIELLPSVKNAFSYFHIDAEEILKDPNGQIIIDDGRRFLERSTEKFDVITIDPPPPLETATSSLLYSTDFFKSVKKHLKPGGIVQEWYYPISNKLVLAAIARSFAQSFSYVKIFGTKKISDSKTNGCYFLASEEPIAIPTPEQFLANMPTAAKDDLPEAKNIITQVLSTEIPINSILNPDRSLIITDDRPFNEYFLLRSGESASRSYRRIN